MPSFPIDLEETFWTTLRERQMPYPRNFIMMFSYKYSNEFKWCCLKCTESHSYSEEKISKLAADVHAAECVGETAVAASRHDLINAITAVEDAIFTRFTKNNIYGFGLIERGGLWERIANDIGWPRGYQGEDGWYADYLDAKTNMGIQETFCDLEINAENKDGENE